MSLRQDITDLARPDKLTSKYMIEAERDDLLALFERYAMKVIGEEEDESLNGLKNTDRQYWERLDASLRNELRTIQRQALKDLITPEREKEE